MKTFRVIEKTLATRHYYIEAESFEEVRRKWLRCAPEIKIEENTTDWQETNIELCAIVDEETGKYKYYN